MEKFKFYLKYSQTLSGLGIILIIFSFLDIIGTKILTLHIKVFVAVAILGLYHVLRSVAQFIEPDD